MKKGLTFEDKALWELISQTVQPLKSVRKILPVQVEKPKLFINTPLPSISASFPSSSRTPCYQLIKIDSKEIKNIVISAKLDLHGYTIPQAEKRLENFIIQNQALDCRWVIVVTGKGLHSSQEKDIGPLKKFTQEWLTSHPHLILGFRETKLQHGGTGALYVKIRRIKKSSPY